MNKNLKAFTLIELVITIAIIVILSTISVPVYRGYTKNARLTEGYALTAQIRDAQIKYYAEYRTFIKERNCNSSQSDYSCNNEVLGIDARVNKYFTLFTVGDTWSDVNKNIRARVCSKECGNIAFDFDKTTGATYTFY